MADEFEIKLKQGETYRKSFQSGQGHLDETVTPPVWVIDVPDDFTGAHARMQIRKAYGTPVLIELTDVPDPAVGSIDLALGLVSLWITDEATDGMVDPGDKVITTAKYDVEIYWASGDTTRWMQGPVSCTENITRDVP